MKNASEALEMFEKHPLTVKLRAEEAAEILKKREAAAAEYAKVEEEAAEVIPEMNEAIEKARQEVKRIEQESIKAREALSMAEWKKFGVSDTFTRRQDKESAFLIETADPAIDENIKFFRDEFSRVHGLSPEESHKMGKKNLLSLTQEHIVTSNVEALRARLRYCLDAQKELEAMKLQPSCNHVRIAKLRKDIPPVNKYLDYVGGKALKNEASTRCTEPIGSLHERVDRLLGR